jgi:hypothetical protein
MQMMTVNEHIQKTSELHSFWENKKKTNHNISPPMSFYSHKKGYPQSQASLVKRLDTGSPKNTVAA